MTGTSNPACTTGSVPGDPGVGRPVGVPAGRRHRAGVHRGSLVTLQPGTYQSAAALNTALTCPVVWLRPGTYYFDFRDAGTHELTVGTGTVVVGGAPSGWTPGTTPAASIPFPTAASPTASACDTTAAGVDIVFGGDSRVNVTGGKVQLCALSTEQHVPAHRGPRALVGRLACPRTDTSTAAASRHLRPAGVPRVEQPRPGRDGGRRARRTSKVPNTGATPSRCSSDRSRARLVPSDATAITVTATVTETVDGSGNTTLVAHPGDGSREHARRAAEDCPLADPCTAGGLVARPDRHGGLHRAHPGEGERHVLRGGRDQPEQQPGRRLGRRPHGVRRLHGAAAADVRPGRPDGRLYGRADRDPVLKASGATTVLALHGTVYAPLATLDLGLTTVPYTVVDRGVVVRHLLSTMTPAAGYTGPLISIPPDRAAAAAGSPGRHRRCGAVLARADVTFADSAGTANGTIPRVNEWSVD